MMFQITSQSRILMVSEAICVDLIFIRDFEMVRSIAVLSDY